MWRVPETPVVGDAASVDIVHLVEYDKFNLVTLQLLEDLVQFQC